MRKDQSKRNKGVVYLTAALLCLGLLSGCQSRPEPPVDAATAAPQTEIQLPEIQPAAQESERDRRQAPLYFRMRGEDMLARETRTVQVPKDKQLEQVLVESLIEGPSASLLDLTGVFIPGTKVLAVESDGDTLAVTLSREFLDTPVDAPSNWSDDPAWRAEVLTRRRLALESIVDTITEATTFTAVQLLVQQDADSTVGQRIDRGLIYGQYAGDPALTPVFRDEAHILNHYNSAAVILESWRDKDFSRMYRYIIGKPTEAAFQQEMIAMANSLVNYELSPGMVAEDGQSAVLSAWLSYTDARGITRELSCPVHLTMENGLWKMTYATLLRLMEAN